MHAYAQARGITIVEVYQEAESAFADDSRRPAFWQMIERARLDRDLDGILVHELSRFSRDSVQAKTLVRELRARGIEVASVSDPEVDPESVAGVYLEAITFAKNEAYSREVAFHTRKGCRAIRNRSTTLASCLSAATALSSGGCFLSTVHLWSYSFVQSWELRHTCRPRGLPGPTME